MRRCCCTVSSELLRRRFGAVAVHSCSRALPQEHFISTQRRQYTSPLRYASPLLQSAVGVGSACDVGAATTGGLGADRAGSDLFVVIDAVDTFAQSRVANLVRRMNSISNGGRGSVYHVTSSRVTGGGLAANRATCDLSILDAAVCEAVFPSGASVWRSDIEVSFVEQLETPRSVSTGSSRLQTKGTPQEKKPTRAVSFVARGYASDERQSTVLASMHAERMLDGMGVHIFALPRMQEKHARDVRAAGRWAPMPHEGPDHVPATMHNMDVHLPLVLRPSSTPQAQSVGGQQVAKKRLSPFSNSQLAPRSFARVSTPPHKAAISFAVRFGAHPLEPVATSAAGPQCDTALGDESTMYAALGSAPTMKDHREESASDNHNNDEDGAWLLRRASELIAEQDVQILTQCAEGYQTESFHQQPPTVMPSAAPLPDSVLLSEKQSGRQFSFRKYVRPHLADESEGGLFTMVEEETTWEFEGYPSLICLIDNGVKKRIEDAFADWEAAIQLSSEGTLSGDVEGALLRLPQLMTVTPVKLEAGIEASSETTWWYEAKLRVPLEMAALAKAVAANPDKVLLVNDVLKIAAVCRRPLSLDDDLVSIGKADTAALAETLCLMHLERLLEQAGTEMFPHDRQRDALLVDAGLRIGRRRGPALLAQLEAVELLSSAALPEALCAFIRRRLSLLRRNSLFLQKPLKLWKKRNRVSRMRHSELSPSEIVLALNRHVISTIRITLIELDLDHHSDWLVEAEQLLRQYFIDAGHLSPQQAELPLLVMRYSENQFRCSCYLPVPKRFGIRGAYAIGTTETLAKRYCAFHALDVLCAIGVPLHKNSVAQEAFVAKRRERGLICPPSQGPGNSLLPRLRSPPAYREVPGFSSGVPPARDLWKLMVFDAANFDVARRLRAEEDAYHARRSASAAAARHKGSKFLSAAPLSALKEDADVAELDVYLRGGETASVRCVFVAVMKLLGLSDADRLRRTSHVAADQCVGQRRRLAANNVWMRLPLDASVYGERIALGRCVMRKNAETMMMHHALRICIALDIPQLEVLRRTDPDVFHLLSQFRSVHWKETSSESDDLHGDRRRILSPNPVMSQDLADKTFV